ncbi:hypothetical protein DL93DRAFT_2097164 [Clavulina sp. PMI_390]|nr:hypothetical protein DL93DRAFT_2097164 [Clavulina sp. PMI_390]
MVQYTSLALAAAILPYFVSAVDPAAVYDGGYGNNSAIALRIGNGGAGQSGLVGVVANAFIQQSVQNGSAPFQVAWYESDTTTSIEYLQQGVIDLGITYDPDAEGRAIDQNIATSPSYYMFRDHFLFIGPTTNPANISSSDDIYTQFSKLYAAANVDTTSTVRFLTRYDKSATNIKDSLLWLGVGQVPWATPYSTWYHQYIAFPIQALTAAILLKEYTITDRGTYLSLTTDLESQLTIYKAATDNATDPLLNPAHIIVGTRAQNVSFATKFAQWSISPPGQAVITNFTKNGQQLYSGAP